MVHAFVVMEINFEWKRPTTKRESIWEFGLWSSIWDEVYTLDPLLS